MCAVLRNEKKLSMLKKYLGMTFFQIDSTIQHQGY